MNFFWKTNKWNGSQEQADFKKNLKQQCDKIRDDSIAFHESLPTDKLEQLILFRRIFPIIFIPATLAVFFGFFFDIVWTVAFFEIGIAIISALCRLLFSKKIKYPNVFWMPVIACLLSVFLAVGFSFGIGKNLRNLGTPFRNDLQTVESENISEIE